MVRDPEVKRPRMRDGQMRTEAPHDCGLWGICCDGDYDWCEGFAPRYKEADDG
jgi:hypothetical protein